MFVGCVSLHLAHRWRKEQSMRWHTPFDFMDDQRIPRGKQLGFLRYWLEVGGDLWHLRYSYVSKSPHGTDGAPWYDLRKCSSSNCQSIFREDISLIVDECFTRPGPTEGSFCISMAAKVKNAMFHWSFVNRVCWMRKNFSHSMAPSCYLPGW